MLALYPDEDLAQALALPGGPRIESIHLTVAYTGPAADVDREALNTAAQALAFRDPVQAVIAGHARFTGGEQDVHVALADGAALEDLRRDALDRLSANGITIPRDHGYTAHLTRAYAGQSDPDPGRLASVPVTFTAISAVHAGVRTDYPFGADPTAGSPMAPIAAEAFAAGYAATGAPVTPRTAPAGYAAVVEACLHEDDPGIIESTVRAGHVAGVQAVIAARREDLLAKHLAAVMAAWNACVHQLNARRLVSAYRHDVFLTDQPAKDDDDTTAEAVDPDRQWWRQTGTTAALGFLRGIYRARGFDALIAAIEDAIRAGMAEGRAGALALAAARQGRKGFSIPAAFAAAYAALDGDHTVTSQAHDVATRIIDGAGADLGIRLATMTADQASYDQMLTGVWGLVAGDKVRAVTALTDQALWAGIGVGTLALYRSLSVENVYWKTGGPNPCPKCQENEDNSPYQPEAVPAYPGHPHCRCELSTTTSLPQHLLAAFLTGATAAAAVSAATGP
jgi:2'-5' RNA ligase